MPPPLIVFIKVRTTATEGVRIMFCITDSDIDWTGCGFHFKQKKKRFDFKLIFVKMFTWRFSKTQSELKEKKSSEKKSCPSPSVYPSEKKNEKKPLNDGKSIIWPLSALSGRTTAGY